MSSRASLLLLCVLSVGCDRVAPASDGSPVDAGSASVSAPVTAPPAPPPRAPERDALRPAGGVLHIAAQELMVGSRPGLVGRDPQREAALVPVPMSAFEIDSEPAERAGQRLEVRSQAEARSACTARGRRLCAELEWEQGCKLGGDGFTWQGLEWTASEGGPSFGDAPTVVVRGGDVDASSPSCAARRALTLSASPRGVGFRCCEGEVNEAPYPAPTRGPAFHPLDITDERVRAVLAQIPELSRYASNFVLFHADDAERALRRCNGAPADLHGWELVDGVLEWAPGWGPSNWVFAGRSGDDALVVVLHRVGDTFAHGSSYVNAGDASPIAISYTPPSRDTLQFSDRVGCASEGGLIAAEDDGRVMTYHRRVGW